MLLRTVNGTQKLDNPIIFFTNGSGLDRKTRPEILLGSDSGITISNQKPDNKQKKSKYYKIILIIIHFTIFKLVKL